MKTKCAIIGGGVAGLSAAIRLAELGSEAVVIESGSYPSHKICGEFLSPECITYLNEWNIHPVAIKKATIETLHQRLVFPFPTSAGGLSHLELDPSLVKKALSCGVKLKTSTKVHAFEQKKSSKEPHLIHLLNDEIIEAEQVIIAAGRFNTYSPPPVMRYKGFKAHFINPNREIDHLKMYTFKGAYLGISPVENDKINVACLAKSDHIGSLDPQIFIQNLISTNPSLHALLDPKKNLFKEWMVGSVSAFGFRQTPNWRGCYFIGDAAMTIPPASGNGLSLAIFGGRLAAEYAVKDNDMEFQSAWRKKCASQVLWAKALHQLMLCPKLCNKALLLSKCFPVVSKKIFDFTRYSLF